MSDRNGADTGFTGHAVTLSRVVFNQPAPQPLTSGQRFLALIAAQAVVERDPKKRAIAVKFAEDVPWCKDGMVPLPILFAALTYCARACPQLRSARTVAALERQRDELRESDLLAAELQGGQPHE